MQVNGYTTSKILTPILQVFDTCCVSFCKQFEGKRDGAVDKYSSEQIDKMSITFVVIKLDQYT